MPLSYFNRMLLTEVCNQGFLGLDAPLPASGSDIVHQKLHSPIDTKTRHIEREVIVAHVIPVAARVGLGINLSGIVVVLDHDARLYLVNVITVHDSPNTDVQRRM